MGDKSQKFCLKWTNYQHHLSESFLSLLQTESMADVTLSAQGKRIHAHRIVLSVCSPLFQWSEITGRAPPQVVGRGMPALAGALADQGTIRSRVRWDTQRGRVPGA
uniref:BTB domain-containing protein n=1 Tax=Timema bartmani TaxID=61472 RepID=A0A7R9FBX8_9NEOP|nr:unnamed protein product [Timema bartmani]